MHQPRRLRLAASLMLCFVLQTLGADKYTDENRPYSFGFKIDGQQHRQESKDTDGIIMGEYGFITADDVYHVTVYATDKEGRFKILSMKNIHLKSDAVSSLSATTSARRSKAFSPAQPTSVQVSAISQKSPKHGGFAAPATPGPQSTISVQSKLPFQSALIEPPGRSCSSCSLPTTTTRAPPSVFNQGNENNNYNTPNQFSPPGPSSNNQQPFPPSSPEPSGSSNPRKQGNPQSYPSDQQNIPQQELVAPDGAPSFAPQPNQTAQNYPSSPNYPQGPGASNVPNNNPPQREAFPLTGQTPSGAGQKPSLFVGKNNPYPGPSSNNQQPFPPSSPEPSGSSNPRKQGNPQSYPSDQQNIPQQELVAPDGAPSFAPQPNQTAQNYPSSPNYPQGPGASNVPNNNPPQREAFPLTGQTPSGAGQKPSLFVGKNNPYARARPSGSPNSASDVGHLSQNNAQQADLSRPNTQATGPTLSPQGGAGERTAKQLSSPQVPGATQGRPRGSTKPTLIYAKMQIVDKNTDIYALGPNEQRGLPPGLSQGDMTQLLYTFNYTLGFQGHFEEGYSNGVKKGYYFVTGRNGVRTRIDYVADDTGFHPKVSQEVLDLLSEEVPKPETEKDEKYGLKGYEFKWLYYPVEPKRR